MLRHFKGKGAVDFGILIKSHIKWVWGLKFKGVVGQFFWHEELDFSLSFNIFVLH